MTHDKKEDFMTAKWRPLMAFLYMLTCACDFILFPILWSALQAVMHAAQITQWQPITLQGAGLFHVAMGAVLGVTAYGRTQEKLGGVTNGRLQTTTTNAFATPTAAATSNFGYMPTATGMAATPAAGAFADSSPATTWQHSQSFANLTLAQVPQVELRVDGKTAPPGTVFPER